MIKIGVGVTSRNRPKILKLWLRQYEKFTSNMPEVEFTLHVQYHYPKHTGIASVKNDCLRKLQDCDYIFLFDSDCFPVHQNWWMPFVEAHLRTGNHHFLWIVDDSAKFPLGLGRKLLKEENGITYFRNSHGCCMFFTKLAVLRAGAFDEAFRGYGYEHENYSLRIRDLGMTEYGFLSVPHIEQFIYSLDVQGTKPYNSQIQGEYIPELNIPVSSMKMSKMRESLKGNKKVFDEERKLYIPL